MKPNEHKNILQKIFIVILFYFFPLLPAKESEIIFLLFFINTVFLLFFHLSLSLALIKTNLQ